MRAGARIIASAGGTAAIRCAPCRAPFGALRRRSQRCSYGSHRRSAISRGSVPAAGPPRDARRGGSMCTGLASARSPGRRRTTVRGDPRPRRARRPAAPHGRGGRADRGRTVDPYSSSHRCSSLAGGSGALGAGGRRKAASGWRPTRRTHGAVACASRPTPVCASLGTGGRLPSPAGARRRVTGRGTEEAGVVGHTVVCLTSPASPRAPRPRPGDRGGSTPSPCGRAGTGTA
ncbi:hypothetical protein MBT84_34990 [Streptomyces sp. MBT84]|nr:hypothetical protein [Streptomyces sp. MBT84]